MSIYTNLNLFDIATLINDTVLNRITKKPLQMPKGLRNHKMQPSPMHLFKPENDFTVREALSEAGHADMIGRREGRIPAQASKDATESGEFRRTVRSG